MPPRGGRNRKFGRGICREMSGRFRGGKGLRKHWVRPRRQALGIWRTQASAGERTSGFCSGKAGFDQRPGQNFHAGHKREMARPGPSSGHGSDTRGIYPMVVGTVREPYDFPEPSGFPACEKADGHASVPGMGFGHNVSAQRPEDKAGTSSMQDSFQKPAYRKFVPIFLRVAPFSRATSEARKLHACIIFENWHCIFATLSHAGASL